MPNGSASASSIIEWSCTASPSTAIADQGQARLNGRALLRIAGLLGLFAVIAPIHIATKALLGRSPWPRRFLASCGWIVGARVHIDGALVARHSLLVANHTSWLDIVLLAGATDCAFVSKDNLGHSLIHWLADQNETVYVRRSHVRGAKDQAVAIAKALEGNKPVALFPEATTGPGTYLLPFRSTLLEAANFAAKAVPIRPVAIDYGAARAEVGWYDNEPGRENVVRILGRRGTLPVAIHLLDPLDRALDRKQLTQQAQSAIAQRLGLTSGAHSLIGEAG